MEIKELRGKEKEELVKLLKEARLGLVKLRVDRKIGSLSDGSTIRKKRREIARITTVLKEKEILGEVVKVAEVPKVVKVPKKTKKSNTQARGTKDAKKKI